IGVSRREPCERIDLEHLRRAVLVEPHVDAPGVTAAEAPPCGERDPLDVVPERARLEQPVVDELAPMRLVAVRVDPLVRAVAKPHLERCKRTCAGTGAENPDRELAPGQEALDEHGLTIVAEQRRARGYELRPRADE